MNSAPAPPRRPATTETATAAATPPPSKDEEESPPSPPPRTPLTALRRPLSFLAMSFLWTGSQLPVYLFGAVPPLIYRDLGGLDRWVWFVTGNLLALAAVCPFVGALSDLLGRRWVAAAGMALVIAGQVACSLARDMGDFIGMYLSYIPSHPLRYGMCDRYVGICLFALTVRPHLK